MLHKFSRIRANYTASRSKAKKIGEKLGQLDPPIKFADLAEEGWPL
jgi:hypothetical protein